MIYYSFYTDRNKNPASLVYRTEKGYSPLMMEMKMFDTEDNARRDFYSLFYDNEDYRFCEYGDTDKKKRLKRGNASAKIPERQDVEKVWKEIPADFKLELNKTYNIDCLAFMKQLPDGYVDYVITSPPYNVGQRNDRGEKYDLYNVHEDEQTDDEYEKWLFMVIDELLRVTKRHIFFNIQMLGNNKRTVMRMCGIYADKIKDRMIWNKKIAPPHILKGTMNSKFEDIFIFSNDFPEKKNFTDGNFQGTFTNVMEGIGGHQNPYPELNRATFPLYLPQTILSKFGEPGYIVYDPFGGTGTTALAAVLEKKQFIATEIDIAQCKAADERIYNENARLKLF